MRKVTVTLPGWIGKEEAQEKVVRNLRAHALLKMEFYRSHMKPFEAKYSTTFSLKVTGRCNAWRGARRHAYDFGVVAVARWSGRLEAFSSQDTADKRTAWGQSRGDEKNLTVISPS